MKFEFDNNRPIYLQLVEQLKLYIVAGNLEPGERLPSVRDLALQTQVNPNTMQKALAELEEMGLIYTERTLGKFVTEKVPLIDKMKKNLASEKAEVYLNEMEKIGFSNEEAILYLQEIGGKMNGITRM